VGRKGIIASTAASLSLMGAALVIVLLVSGFVAFKGFSTSDSTREIRQDARLAPVRSAATPQPQRVVVGARRSSRGDRTRRGADAARIHVRGRHAAARAAAPVTATVPARPAPSPARAAEPEPEAEEPAKESLPVELPESVPVPERPTKPVDELVTRVAEPVETVAEKVGDVLLDVRDVLPR
jgi:hypothetical protein